MISPNKTRRKLQTQFICVHWTGGSYAGSVSWCLDPKSQVSYHTIIGPKAERSDIVPYEFAAWSVGWAKTIDPRVVFVSDNKVCQSNHASESVALAGCPPKKPTDEQIQALVLWITERFRALGWTADDIWRIWGHDQCATFPPGHKKFGQFGRKDDPQGQEWLNLQEIKDLVYAQLGG